MRDNLFEIGRDMSDGWSADNKTKPTKPKDSKPKEPNKHQLHFAKEKRRGKVVTIVRPFHLKKDDMQALLKTLKKKLGTGGTIKDDSLEFQGDIATTLRTQLEIQNFRFKK